MKPIPGLQDIQGLDAISFWPLAPGWWILLALLASLLALAVVLQLRRRAQLRNWRHHALKRLDLLETTLSPVTSQATAIEISELLRRLAILRFSRTECAGLEGNEWLIWLSRRDPAKFNWLESSKCLIQAPFSPPGIVVDSEPLRKTINAAKAWVR